MMTEYKEIMALKATRGQTSGKQGRLRNLCQLFVAARQETLATGKPWWKTATIERSDYGREETMMG